MVECKTMAMDFSNFDTSSVPEKGNITFEQLKAGQYVMRVVGFSRTKTKAGADALVFKLQVLKGLTPEGSTRGDCLWFVNLSERGAGFVREALVAVQPKGWTGNLFSDDEVKEVFLGKVIVARISIEIRKEKSYPSVGKVASYGSGDFSHDPSEKFWNVSAMREKSAFSSTPTPSGDSQDIFKESPSNTGSGFNNDDDIPF
jgi:hypothetical protein